MKKHIDGYIEVTRRCNQRCTFCSFPPKESEMSIEEIKTRVLKLKKMGISELVLTGGEPTMREELPQIISFATSLGLDTRMITNGARLSDEKLLDKLIENGLDRVAVSIHSHVRETSEKISRSNNFKNTIKGMENMEKKGITFDTNTTVISDNYKQLPEFVNFIADKFKTVKFMTFNYVDGVGNSTGNKQIVPKISNAEYYLNNMFNELHRLNMKFHIERVPLCYMVGFETHSSETLKFLNGDYIIVSRSQVNADSQEYHKGSSPKDYTKALICKNCSLSEICAGIPKAYCGIYGDNELYARFKPAMAVRAQYLRGE